ncbi:efflux transporter periplasmic adaptor subunit [Brevirhabdus pacifica]|uniref:Efflux transporter periplasmic adaptor subunit n=1 Tax=Brevirhabdus pacifica TaxID=1267768 RepID=A0A1U7DFY9_9RHOB|nr:efflux RND transporter periplasmic adaptor subunit [Brevirhabdus pacifica]APX88813.1 efflux transporter periplasmic adaptor subunit [Brevirhabdus pacifica]PJJ86655.1 multidrug efflux system membrane fusion protein [Brevirhabdus pacifica]
MKLLPLITAALVVFALYVSVFERDRVLEFARSTGFGSQQEETVTADSSPTEGTADPDTAPAPEAQGEHQGADDGVRRVSVVALRSHAAMVDSAVTLRGRTEASRQVDVRSETSGLIRSAPLPKGSKVTAGQVLCEVAPGTREISLASAQSQLREAQSRLPEARARVPEAEARLSEARARVKEAEARLAEAEINQRAASRLGQGGFASEIRVVTAQAALEAARAGVETANSSLESARSGIESALAGIEAATAGIQSAQAGVAAAEKELERLNITAPFDGLLESDTAELGSLLQPGALCATLLRLDPILLVGFVPELEVGRITVGAPATARLVDGTELTGDVSFLSRAADEATRTFRVEVTVPNADLTLSDGQTAEILIAAPGVTAHFLPQSALTLNDHGDLGVRVVGKDSLAHFQPVSVQRDTARGIWLSGLPESADVIVLGQEYVTEGSPVTPTYREGLDPEAGVLPAQVPPAAPATGPVR